jgi:hypothetical protein
MKSDIGNPEMLMRAKISFYRSVLRELKSLEKKEDANEADL